MDIARLFDEAQRARVTGAVEEAEAHSRGQIVPVVVGRSDPYPEARFRGALLGAALAAAAALLASPRPVSIAELLLVELAGGLLGALAGLWDPLERLLVGPHAMGQAVRSRALRAFHENGLHRTVEGTGVLVFASLLERQAVVLGDHGIHARMGDEGWADAVAALVEGMGRGAPTEGLVEAIGRCGAKLQAHFPPGAGATAPRNELEDTLRVSPT
jgi:putative membrane protein